MIAIKTTQEARVEAEYRKIKMIRNYNGRINWHKVYTDIKKCSSNADIKCFYKLLKRDMGEGWLNSMEALWG